MNDPASEEPSPRSDRPEASALPEAPASPEAPALPEAPASPEAVGAGPEAAPRYGAPPDTAAFPPDPALLAPALPPAPSGRNVARIVFGAASIAVLAGVLVFALIKHLDSTGSVRVVLPAPAAAGGLNQDYADERGGQFHTAVSELDQSFQATIHGGKFVAAIYTNAPAGSSVQGASVALVYIGINAPPAADNGPKADPASAVKSVLSGISSEFTHASLVQEGGGPGDTRYACETGNSTSGSIVVCAWGTDRTAGLLIPQAPINIEPLSALMKKMEPDLVRS
jgi:hypothetical protein